jgi:hypothetical protein
MRTSAFLFILTVLGVGIASAAVKDEAGETNCCAGCGRHTACVAKTCQVVCDVKKEKKTTWSVQCEEICPLMPGHRECGECAPPPRCGHSKCVKKLVKKEYEVEVPIYKCVVLRLCPECACGELPAAPTAIPAAPAVPQTAPPPPAPLPRPPAPKSK